MVLPGITMTVIGEDATLLKGPLGADLSYDTNTVSIGPGESRDVLFTAPPFDAAGGPGRLPMDRGTPTVFKNRNYDRLTNNGLPGPGGMMTEVRVFDPAGGLPLQTPADLNKTYA